MPSTEEWLRSRSDAELAELLTARPDVLLPAPADFATLARRLDSTATVRRAIAGCTAFELAVLQAIWALGGGGRPEAIAGFIGGPATDDDAAAALAALHIKALVREADRGYLLPPTVEQGLGRYPAGLGAATGLAPDRVRAALDTASEAELALLRRLVPGPPVGTIPADSPQRPTVSALVAQGLLTEVTPTTVTLPREVALALRGPHPLGEIPPRAPDFETTTQRAGMIDGAAGGAALAARSRAAALIDLLGAEGVGSLKSGGIGIVAVRQLAKALDCPVGTVALYLELLHALGMIAPALRRGAATATWLPTAAADQFLTGPEAGGWALLASCWLDLRRDASRVGRHDAGDKIIGALSVGCDWRRGPADRRRVLRVIAALPPDVSPARDSVVARLAFTAPLADRAQLAAVVDTVLDEATELGVCAFDALAGPGRSILAGEVEEAAAALTEVLPAPVESVLVQADMTIIAPGRLTPSLAAALAEMADVESSGSATVYRVSEGSIRRALDAGATRTELQQLLQTHATSPVPQSVSYLIDDVARRFGVLRAGAVAAVVHSDDEALVSQAIAAAGAAGLPLRRLAPTVAVSGIDLTTLMEALRAAGLSPAAEDAHGDVIDLRPPPARTRAPIPPRPAYTEPAAPSQAQLDAVIRRLRAGAPGPSEPAADARDIVAVLKEAARERSAVWIGYADAQGGTAARSVEPIVVSGGTMVAYDTLRGAPRTFVLSRISSARLNQ